MGNRVPLKAIRFVAAGLFGALGVWTLLSSSSARQIVDAALEVMRSYGNRMNEPLSQWSNQRDRLQLPALPRYQGR
jgi:hypothetical protein